LHHSGGASEPVGTPVFWTATNAAGTATLQFRWVITQNGTNVVFRDFNTTSIISYAPVQEGSYTVTVTARNPANFGDADTVSTTYTATSLLKAGGAPNVAGTHNPLIAIYSATCASGSNIRVFFARDGTPVTSGFATPIKACTSGKSVNFIIAGMRASTTYNLAQQIRSGSTSSFGPTLQFTTGSIPASVPVPTMAATGTPTTEQRVILEAGYITHTLPVAFDASGHVIWYSYTDSSVLNFLYRPLNGGRMQLGESERLQDIDLLDNVLRETNVTRMSEQLSGPPFNIINPSIPNRIAAFTHDAIQLPNGYTAALSLIEQLANQGQGTVDVVADLILVLDKNYQLKWAWNPFAHGAKLPITRRATLNETCASGSGGCPALKFRKVANDWIHGNSLCFTADGNLLFSMRNQDWVIKIDYANGTGNGDILWRLGKQGDFTLGSGEQWFSHQHNATLTGSTLSLFDNATGDHADFGGSRGLVLEINEQEKTANIVDEALMHTFSDAFGSAQILLNGNLWFLSGDPTPNQSEAIEFKPGLMATPVAHFDINDDSYRAFRMKDLYTP